MCSNPLSFTVAKLRSIVLIHRYTESLEPYLARQFRSTKKERNISFANAAAGKNCVALRLLNRKSLNI